MRRIMIALVGLGLIAAANQGDHDPSHVSIVP